MLHKLGTGDEDKLLLSLYLVLWNLAFGNGCSYLTTNPDFGVLSCVKGVINLPYAETEEPLKLMQSH